MAVSKLSTRVFLTLLAVAALSVGGMGAAMALAIRGANGDAAGYALGQAVRAVAYGVSLDPAGAQAYSRAAAGDTGLRVTVLGPDGTVLGDSRSDPAAMANHADRPEVAEALNGRTTAVVRESETLGVRMLYAAAPLFRDGKAAGAVRLAMDMPDLSRRMTPFLAATAVFALVLLAALALVSARIGSAITGPSLAMAAAARAWSAGDLDARVRSFDDRELAVVSDTMNAMAADLSARMREMERRERELAAILDGMTEGVMAVDTDLGVRLVNPRARELLGRPGDPAGMSLLRWSGSTALEEMAKACLVSGKSSEREVAVYGDQPRTLLAHASPLALGDGPAGVVLVLTDMTRLQRLERVRTDFVANVSHELRTPITLVKGFVETIEAGTGPDETRRFLRIIGRHADRMAAIVEDLLLLAGLEDRGRAPLETVPVPADRVMAGAVESLGDGPAARGMRVTMECEPGLQALADEGLLEQALVNLLDNAVKYGPEGSEVILKAEAEPVDGRPFALFTVTDRGPGIPAKHLPRLFERFYRVDRARSRELGGTGLGLAIVKHIAVAHGGEVFADSREGYGSTFGIRVPSPGLVPPPA